jgi:protocatechuate 3,4-dioxygenase beta subunit
MNQPQTHALEPLDNDDALVGRVLSRREVLALFGATGTAAFLAACAPAGTSTSSPAGSAAASPAAGSASASGAAASASSAVIAPSCIVRPALTEGPYFVDEKLQRADIRSDPGSGTVKEGLPLALTFAVSKIDGASCTAFQGALVDVWHCDALGAYSDVQDPGFSTAGQKWLRGYLITDANGRAAFTTIYPGWYQGRAVHIHFKIRSDAAASSGLEFTSQLFFDDTVSDQVFTRAPYSQKGGQRGVRNENDGIFGQSGGNLTLQLTGDATNGYEATFPIGVQVS